MKVYCSICGGTLPTDDDTAMADHHVNNAEGDLRYIELAHLSCAQHDNRFSPTRGQQYWTWDATIPRVPTDAECEELGIATINDFDYTFTWISIFDHYITDGPGFAGKLAILVGGDPWCAGPVSYSYDPSLKCWHLIESDDSARLAQRRQDRGYGPRELKQQIEDESTLNAQRNLDANLEGKVYGPKGLIE